MSVNTEARQAFVPAPPEEGGSRPVIVVDLPWMKDTSNYRRVGIPYDREITQTNGGFYLTYTDLHHLGSPRSVRVTIEALD